MSFWGVELSAFSKKWSPKRKDGIWGQRYLRSTVFEQRKSVYAIFQGYQQKHSINFFSRPRVHNKQKFQMISIFFFVSIITKQKTSLITQWRLNLDIAGRSCRKYLNLKMKLVKNVKTISYSTQIQQVSRQGASDAGKDFVGENGLCCRDIKIEGLSEGGDLCYYISFDIILSQLTNMNHSIDIAHADSQNEHQKVMKPEIHPILKSTSKCERICLIRQEKNICRSRQNFSTKGWSLTENRRYAEFLSKNKSLFDLSFQEKKRIRLNVLMSQKVKTRSATQCHSHHQNMMSRYGSKEEIIKQYCKPSELLQRFKVTDSVEGPSGETEPACCPTSFSELQKEEKTRFESKTEDLVLPDISFFACRLMFPLFYEESSIQDDWLSE